MQHLVQRLQLIQRRRIEVVEHPRDRLHRRSGTRSRSVNCTTCRASSLLDRERGKLGGRTHSSDWMTRSAGDFEIVVELLHSEEG